MDKIIIHSLWEYEYRSTATIEGEVLYPGSYDLTKNMKVSDLIFKAGNLLDSAYLKEAEVASKTQSLDTKTIITTYKTVDIKEVLENNPVHDITLKPYDRVFIKKIPSWRQNSYVTLSGEVRFPGNYLIHSGEKLSELLKRCGGFTDNAYLRGATFTRISVKALQQRQLDEMLNRLQTTLLSAPDVGLTSEETAKVSAFVAAKKEKLIERLREIEPTGRMIVEIKEPSALKETKYDIELEDGDTLLIPRNPNSIQIIGSVYNQSSFIYDKTKTIEQYIALSGGYQRSADKKNMYVLKVNGSAVRYGKDNYRCLSWEGDIGRWQSKCAEIEAGDTIVVPEMIETTGWFNKAKDISNFLYQIAVTTGVVINALP
ncbi:capsule polysaccharide transporter [Candidatus Magnetoovum chiemensis]|nr:capsule polysaccharide transporter [Candidatus Magnetoovum chiemensis]